MENRKLIKIAIFDTIKWTFLTSAVGLAQVITHFLVASQIPEIPYSVEAIFQNGTLTSFCLALVASIHFDAHFQKNHNKKIISKEFNGIIFKYFPWLIVFFVTVSTVISLFQEKTVVDDDIVMNLQITAVIASLLYTFFYKYNSYLIGLNSNNDQ